MYRIFAAQGSLIVSIALVQLVNGYMGTLVGIRLASAGTGSLATGIVTSCFFLGYAIGSVLCKNVIQGAGHIRAFAAFAALVAVSTLALSIYFGEVAWAVCSLATGFGAAGLFVATESWLNVKSTVETRGKVFSIYMVATYLTFGGSQFMLLLAAPEEPLLFELGAIILCIAIGLVATTRSEQPGPARVIDLKPGELLRAAPVAAIGCLISGVNTGAFYALVPVFGRQSGYSTLTISSYIALAIFGGFLLQIPIGRLSDRFDRRAVAGGCALAFAACALSLQFARGSVALEPIWLLLGGFMSVVYPTCVAHANDRMPAGRAVVVSGRLILISGCGSAMGPLLGSAVMGFYGVVGLFDFFAVTAGLFGLFAVTRVALRRAPFRRSRQTKVPAGMFTQELAQAANEAPVMTRG